jgi:hypothetical protein
MATSINWEASLPQKYEQSGYSEGNITNTIVTSQMDGGPIKRRNRSTAGYMPITVSMYLNNTQVNTFKDFYINTIRFGALSFNFPDINGSPYEVFLDSRTLVPTSGTSWKLTMNLTAIVLGA